MRRMSGWRGIGVVSLGWAVGLAAIGCGGNRPVGSSTSGLDPGSAPAADPGAPTPVATGGAAGGGSGGASGSGRTPPAIRLLSPLSGSVADSLRPVFRWAGGSGRGTVCRDRACGNAIASFEGANGQARPTEPLPAGTFFWRVVTSRGPTATWQITIPHRESGNPIAFASVPDYNGDGLADVAFGVTSGDAGRVEIRYGATDLPSVDADVTLRDGPGFGCGVAAVGDLNGDGFTELAVSSSCGDSPAAPVSIFDGGPGGPTNPRMLGPGAVTAGFGTTMASAGDVNGDGYGDLIVGGREVAQVFLGGPKGVSSEPFTSLASGSADGATTVQGPGDVNGDGIPDVAVTFQIFPGAVYLGTGSGFVRQDVTLQTGGGASFAGDFNGDGFDDFDSFAILPGSPAGVDPNFFVIQAGMPFYTAAGDANGDGFWDEIQFVPLFTNFPERYHVVFGGPESCGGTNCRPFASLFPPGKPAPMFAIVAGVGDVDGDGADDLVVARPSIGNVSLFLARTGFSGAPARTWTGPAGFGASVPALLGTATFFGTP